MAQDKDQDDEKLEELAEALKVYRDSMKQLELLQDEVLHEAMERTKTKSLSQAREKLESLIK